ncbi:unnamed protein product [Prorocentrum cordatum]|uniref:EGF-like domain-containing protein n=1 Tax=Prorocentrum cordatum TaxID=2364126 RepID=A0ABN9TUR0_9DINO|nr:unnamed protein product [Polarella glacialis]
MPLKVKDYCSIGWAALLVILALTGPLLAFAVLSCTSTRSCDVWATLARQGAYCREGDSQSQQLMHEEECTVVCPEGYFANTPKLVCDDGTAQGASELQCEEIRATGVDGGLVSGAVTGGLLRDVCPAAANLECTAAVGSTAIFVQYGGIDQETCAALLEECRTYNEAFDWGEYASGVCTMGCFAEVVLQEALAAAAASINFGDEVVDVFSGVVSQSDVELCSSGLVCYTIEGNCNSEADGDYFRHPVCASGMSQWAKLDETYRIRYDDRAIESMGGRWMIEQPQDLSVDAYGLSLARQPSFVSLPVIGTHQWDSWCTGDANAFQQTATRTLVEMKLRACTCTDDLDCNGHGVAVGSKEYGPNCKCYCDRGWSGDHCDYRICRAPAVLNADQPSCLEGLNIEPGGKCTPACKANYYPTVGSLTCSEYGNFSSNVFGSFATSFECGDADISSQLSDAANLGIDVSNLSVEPVCGSYDCNNNGVATGMDAPLVHWRVGCTWQQFVGHGQCVSGCVCRRGYAPRSTLDQVFVDLSGLVPKASDPCGCCATFFWAVRTEVKVGMQICSTAAITTLSCVGQAALRPVAPAARPCDIDAAMAPTRKENASPWYCKWCRHDVTNQPWFNASTLVYCKKCGLHKSSCFKENKAASQPSVSAKQQSLAAKVKELEAQLTKLREHPPGHGSATTGTGASPPWAAAPGDADTAKRNRIKMLDQLLRVTTDPADDDTVAKWREERARLDAELFQDRPIEHQARSLASRLSSARSRQATIQATRDEQQREIDEPTRGLADTDSKLQEAAAEVLRLEQQTRTAMSRVQPPEGAQPPTLADLLPTFAVSVEQLGKVASGLGLGADMVKELQAMADTVSKLLSLPQAKPPEPAPAHDDGDEASAEPPDIEMSEQEYRETLGAAGVHVEESGTPDIVREKFKRLQQSYLDTVAKKAKTSDLDCGSAYVGCACSWVFGVRGTTEGYSACAYAVGPWQHALLTDPTFGERRQRAPTVFGRHAPLTALALATSNFGGVAVLVPTYIMVTAPPDDGHIIYPGRAVCAQISWGVAGGIIVASVYLVTSIGISGENIEVLWALAQRVAAWNSRGPDWILGGDWNTDIDALNVRNWVGTMAAIHYVPDQHTCITDEGKSTIYYFVVCANLASRIKGKPEVQYDSTVVPPPHFPVELQLVGEDRPTWCRVPVEPRPFAVVPPVGCARHPYPWHMLQTEFQRVSSVDDLSSLWDSVLRGVDYELAGRYDCVGAKAMQYIGREGPPQFKWQHLSWQPPRRRTYKEPTVLAWATAKRWAQHLVAEKKRLVRYIERLKLCAAVCAITPLQYTKGWLAWSRLTLRT